MASLAILVLEKNEADLAHHNRILEKIPQSHLALTADPEAAVKMLTGNRVDLMVIDDGIADGCLAFLKAYHLRSGRRDLPVIAIVGNGEKESRRALYEYGVYNVIEKPVDPASYLCIARNALSVQIMRHQDTQSVTAAVEQYKALQAQLEEREVQVVFSVLHTVNFIDEALSRRMSRVAAMAARIAHRTSLPVDESRRCGIAARIYDVGMLVVSHSVRERRLSLDARALKPHTERADEIFGKNPPGLLAVAARIARSHHERFDGRGYPDGLSASDIPLQAQIVSVAEAFVDATTVGVLTPGHASPQALSAVQAVAFVDRQTGTAYDPEVTEALRLAIESPFDVPTPSSAGAGV